MKLPRFRWPDIDAPQTEPQQPLAQRLLWMAAIWLASTGALLLLAWVIRSVIRS
jgi:hypothetical protein